MVRRIISIIFLGSALVQAAQEIADIRIGKPAVILSDVPVSLEFRIVDRAGLPLAVDTVLSVSGLAAGRGGDRNPLGQLSFNDGVTRIEDAVFSGAGSHTLQFEDPSVRQTVRVIPGWLSLVPPLAAILLALIVRQVLVALFVGIWLGASIIFHYNPWTGFLNSLTDYIALAPADPDKMAILIFSLTLGGMVGVISKMGGTQGVVNRLSHYASDHRRGQLATWLMGVVVFFDDYANTLIVGSTMRPLADKLRISREKLSYLVDSTAAPVANIAIISTWIGFEISLIASAFENLGITDNAYITFIRTIPFNYYPIFSLLTGFLIAFLGRDYGPMYRAEKRTYLTGRVLADGATPISNLDAEEITAEEDTPKRWFNGIIPIAVVILATLAGLWMTGLTGLQARGISPDETGLIRYVSTVIGESDSFSVLMWAAFSGSIVAILMALIQRLLTLEKAVGAWVGGIKAMLLAALILTLAWSIGNICADLGTADYVIHISRGMLSPHWIPVLSFIIAAVISFATGTSWGVMAILMPIVIPIAHLLPQADPAITSIQTQNIFLSTIASVLAGATFGDHCSPISDTTIMSSMASGADHIDHVRTQLPYAMLAGLCSIAIGYIPAGYGMNTYVLIAAGSILIILFIRFLAQPVRD